MSEGRFSEDSPQAPEPETVRNAFQSHHDHFSGVSGEVSIQQLETEQGIKRQYSGRLLYELLQNALDSADSKILVQLAEVDARETDHVLVVANDGQEITVNQDYNYEIPPERREAKRPDFNALCSIRTSNKSADDSVGNKGIGFRSVFAVGEYARVWSRFREASGWWGIEMHLPMDGATWSRRLRDPRVRNGHEMLLKSSDVKIEADVEHPSFHFPLPLQSSDQPESLPDLDAFTTAVVVPIEPDHLNHLRASFEEMRQSHLYFLGLFGDRRDITVRFETEESAFTRATWPENDGHATHTVTHWESIALEGDARAADLDISEPGAAIAWPERPAVKEETGNAQAKIYGYLPTELESPFGVDVHGDFQLRTDRTGLQLEDDVIGPYNRKLLEIGAEIHLVTVMKHLGLSPERIEWEYVDPDEVCSTSGSPESEQVREDFWRLLDPGTGISDAADAIVGHIETLLFTGGSAKSLDHYSLWAEFAERYFEEKSSFSLQTYHDFWNASKHWVDQVCPHSDRSQTWQRMVTMLCDAVRETEASVVPVKSTEETASAGLKAVPLPERGKGPGGGMQRRHSRAVFLRDADDELLPLPEALRQANRAVTSFQFPSSIVVKSPQPLGTRQFNRWEVLSELRQIPNSRTQWSPEPLAADRERACELQRGLIRFAADLYCYESGGGGADPTDSSMFGPGWRALETAAIGKTARRAGRAVATLYLPSGDETWEPAHQLTRDQVDESRLGPLPEELDIDSFLMFLGVGPSREEGPPLTLVEGGADGRVPPREIPPQLENAGQGNVANISLDVLPGSPTDTATPETWREALSEVWDSWLAPLITAERGARADEGGKTRLDLVEPLARRPWYPLDREGQAATSPRVLNETDDAIAPRSITLLSRRQQSFPSVLWTVASESPDRELLTAVGAIDGVDTETLSQNDGEPAFRLLKQLRTKIPLKTVSQDPVSGQALVDLFGRILESIAATDHEAQTLDSLYLLSYEPEQNAAALSDRTKDWKSLSEEGWIVSDTADREIMRRFFPDETLVAGEIGPRNLQQYEPLQDRGVKIKRTVKRTPLSMKASDRSGDVESQIESVVPTLLALAEATLQLDIDSVATLDRWRKRTFEHVDNGWVKYEAVLGDARTEEFPWLRDSSGNAFYDESGTPTIFFDTADDADPEYPPLAEFGEPLSALLFEERRRDVSSLFARALSEFDSPDGERRLEGFVAKTDAGPLVESYERRFRPLDEDEEAELIARTEAALEEIDLGLSERIHSGTYKPKLGPDDVARLESAEQTSAVTQQEINIALRSIELAESQTQYAPHFNCESEHYQRWGAWFRSNDERLVPYLAHLCQTNGYTDLEADDVEQKLDGFVSTTACSSLCFEPKNAIIQWLKQDMEIPGEAIPSAENLITVIREFSPRYKAVDRLPRPGSEGRLWQRRGSVDSPTPGESEGGTFSESEAMERMRRQGAVGEDAEVAFRHIVTEQTAECLQRAQSDDDLERVEEMLFRPFETDGKTASNLREGLNRWKRSGREADLGNGLHVSQVWDGAGFDLLGLECNGGNYQLVRYEVKALPGSGSKAKVHLSSNQFAVYRDVRLKSGSETDERYRGDWKLVGVDPHGNAEDLTADLSELPKLLDQLRSAGFGHDGVVLHVSRNPESAALIDRTEEA